MCVRATRAVGLEFAGVDLIREKMGQTYVTEVNGNPGTGIIDVTGQNYFSNLVQHIETRTKREDTVVTPVPLRNKEETEKHQQDEEEAITKRYDMLLSKEKVGQLSYNENGILAFLKKKLGK